MLRMLPQLTEPEDQQSEFQDTATTRRGTSYTSNAINGIKANTCVYQGGFSYVYLVEDSSTHELFALKKIRCPFGQESVSLALKEVEAYSLFTPHPNIIHAVDHSVAKDKSDPSASTVYILLPYYRRGNLQDMINANLVNHTKFPEKRLMQLFLGVCKALKAMHQYKVRGGPGGERSAAKARRVRDEAEAADRQAAREAGMDEDEAAEGLLEAEGEITRSQDGVAPGQVRAYAHRDIKPGMIPLLTLCGPERC